MKLIETLIDLIVEAAPEEIYKKYYSDIERPTFLRIIGLDPASKIQSDEKGGIKKIGRYSKLLLKMFKEGNLKSEDFPKAKDYLSLVYKHNVPVDLNKVKTLGDLFNLVEKYYSRDDNKNVFDLVNTLDDNDYELLLSGEKWIIYRPKSEKGASYLGTGTEWCTAWGPYSTNQKYQGRKNHFSHHNNSGWLYVMISRENPEEKYQFHFETKQFMDKNDRKIDTGNFFDNHGEITKYFYPSLYDDTPVDSEETDRMGFLSSSLKARLVEKAIGDSDNPLVNDLINLEGDELIEKLKTVYIDDPSLNSIEFDYLNREISSPTIHFEIDELNGDLRYVAEVSSYYRADSDPYSDHTESLREDIRSGDEEWQRELLEPLMKEYYDEVVTYSKDYEYWKSLMEDHFESLVDDYADEYGYLNEPLVTTAAETELNNIEKFIIVYDDGQIDVTPSNLALFIHREKLTKITDVESLFDAYVNHHDLVFEYESPLRNIDHEYPTLNEMRSHFDGYSEKIEEELNQTPECQENKEKLIDIRNKFFNKGNYYSREDLRIEIKGGYDCEKGGVKISLDWLEKSNENVSNWKRYVGTVDLERLVAYVTNEKLFESE